MVTPNKFVIGVVHNMTCMRGELTGHKPDEVSYKNQLVLERVAHQVYTLVNLSLIIQRRITC